MKMTIYRILAYKLGLLGLLACHQPPAQPQVWISRPTQTWQPEDPMLQTRLWHLTQTEEGYAVVATTSSSHFSVYRLDSDLRVIDRRGQRGKGPEDFIGLPSLCAQGGKLYLLERGRLHQIAESTGQQTGFYLLPEELPSIKSFSQIMAGAKGHLWYTASTLAAAGSPRVVSFAVKDSGGIEPAVQWGQLGDHAKGPRYESGIHLALPDSTFLWFPDHYGGIERINTQGKRLDSLSISRLEPHAQLRSTIEACVQQKFGGEEFWQRSSWRIFTQPLVLGDLALVASMRNDPEALLHGGPLHGHWVVLRWRPRLEYLGEWETDPEFGHFYRTFCLAQDSLSLLAYEQERGEFHRIPFPPELVRMMEE